MEQHFIQAEGPSCRPAIGVQAVKINRACHKKRVSTKYGKVFKTNLL